jgi:hypothetical protein
MEVKSFFFKKPKFFDSKPEIDWMKFGGIGAVVLVLFTGALLLLPAQIPEEATFREKATRGEIAQRTTPPESHATDETLAQVQAASASTRPVPQSLDSLYRPDTPSSSGGRGVSSSGDRSVSMVLARSGLDSKNQLPPGTNLNVRISSRVVVTNQAMPVLGVVVGDVTHESSLAIPDGARIMGEATFDASNERANIVWKSVVHPDGRERPIVATGVGNDGRPGVGGKLHSNGAEASLGVTLTKFLGAYAEGSKSQGAFGSTDGGNANGLKNAISETAQDRASEWAKDISEEQKWMEIEPGTVSRAVLNQGYTFRDPGSVHGG